MVICIVHVCPIAMLALETKNTDGIAAPISEPPHVELLRYGPFVRPYGRSTAINNGEMVRTLQPLGAVTPMVNVVVWSEAMIPLGEKPAVAISGAAYGGVELLQVALPLTGRGSCASI